MLAIIPVTKKTAALLDTWEELLKKLGPNDVHNLMVVSCPSVAAVSQQFGEAVSRLFANVEVKVLDVEVGDNTSGRNYHFKSAAYLAASRQLKESWVWLEHATPTQRGWLSALQEEVNVFGKPFVGCEEETVYYATDEEGKDITEIRDPETNEITRQALFRLQDSHMRFGIYPAEFAIHSQLIEYLKAPFELELQYEVVPHMAKSERMATIWASADFERQDDGLIIGGKTNESPYRKVKPIDDNKVVLIHGCRDGSLAALILRKDLEAVGLRPIGQASEELDTLREELEDKIAQEKLLRENAEKALYETTKELNALKESGEGNTDGKKLVELGEENADLHEKLAKANRERGTLTNKVKSLEKKLAEATKAPAKKKTVTKKTAAKKKTASRKAA